MINNLRAQSLNKKFTFSVEAATYDKVFKDVTKKNVNFDIIHEMASQGVINGYEDGTFRGGLEITRQHESIISISLLRRNSSR